MRYYFCIFVKVKNRYIIALCFGVSSSLFAQDCENILFTGKVVDSLRPQSFYNLMIVNRSTGKGVFGQPNGTFSVYASQGDTIALSVRGYPYVTVIVNGNSECRHEGKYFVENKIQDVAEVVVYPLKSLEQIKEERSSLALRETRMVTGIEVLQSPITALYQAFSKKEKAKRWVAEQEHIDSQRNVLKELMRTYVAYDVIELSDDEFDEFIAFLNMDETFLKTATEMELITFIQDKFDHYQWLKVKNRDFRDVENK